MKQIKLIFILMTLLISIFIVGATLTSDSLTPADGTTDMWGKAGGDNITFTATFREGNINMNITNITFLSDIDGTWGVDGTLDAPTLGLGSPYTWTYEYNGSSRGVYTWNWIAYSDGIYAVNESFNITAFATGPNNQSGNVSSLILDEFPIKDMGTFKVENASDASSGTSETLSSTLYTINYATGNLTFALSDENYTRWNNSLLNMTYYRNESRFATVNRSITIGTAPYVAIDFPADAIVSKTINQTFVNFSVVGEAPKYWCSLYTNTTIGNNWVQVGVTETVEASQINQSNVTITYEFPEENDIEYAIFCAESATTTPALANIWTFSSNQTLSIDDTVPTIIGFTPANNSYLNDSYVRAGINVTDINLQSCNIFVNDVLNRTNNSMVSGELWVEGLDNITLIPDGEWRISYSCNDTAANEVVLNWTIMNVDTGHSMNPGINITNVSYTGYLDRYNLTWRTNETANSSISWMGDAGDGIAVSIDGGYGTVHEATITFNGSELWTNITITSCDRAGNCNVTNMSTTSPKELRSGWSEFAVFDDLTLELGDIVNGSGSPDFVYVWNATNQDWISISDLYVGNGLYTLEFGEVYFLYSSTNETFWRDVLGTGVGSYYYHYNFTTGHNFVGITDVSEAYTFSNLSLSLLENYTYFDSPNKFNWTHFSGWNLSQETVDYYYNWSWNNETLLGRTYDIESVWIWANRNVSWNGTNITKVDWSI